MADEVEGSPKAHRLDSSWGIAYDRIVEDEGGASHNGVEGNEGFASRTLRKTCSISSSYDRFLNERLCNGDPRENIAQCQEGQVRYRRRDGEEKRCNEITKRSFLPRVFPQRVNPERHRGNQANRRVLPRVGTPAYKCATRNQAAQGPVQPPPAKAREVDMAVLHEALQYTEKLMKVHVEKEENALKAHEIAMGDSMRGSMRRPYSRRNEDKSIASSTATSATSSASSSAKVGMANNQSSISRAQSEGPSEDTNVAECVACNDDASSVLSRGSLSSVTRRQGSSRGWIRSWSAFTNSGGRSGTPLASDYIMDALLAERSPYASAQSSRTGVRSRSGSARKLRGKINSAKEHKALGDWRGIERGLGDWRGLERGLEKGDFSVCSMNSIISMDDVDDEMLIQNVERELTVQKLRTDLRRSQRVIQESEAFFRQVSREFFTETNRDCQTTSVPHE